MGDLTRIATLLLTATLATGCVTGPSVVDLVAPHPISRVAVERQADGALQWTATYGRRHSLFTVEVTRSGALDVPQSLVGCSPFVHYSLQGRGPGEIGELLRGASAGVDSLANSRLSDATRIPPSPGTCAYLLVTDEAELRRILFVDLDGRPLDEHILPLDRPFLSPKRWATLVSAPFLDVCLMIAFPVMMAAGASLS